MAQKITMTITPGGRVEVDAEGFEGCSCEEATEAVHLVLGGRGKTDYKPEYYAAPAIDTQTQSKATF